MRLRLLAPQASPVGLVLGLTLAVTAALIAGCGSSGSSGNGVASKTPAEIVAATKVAADAASSVHVSGSIVSNGSPITLDLDLLEGKGGRGQLSESGLSFELIQTGGTVYINGSPAFYRHVGGSAAAQLFQGKWLKAPASSGSFASLPRSRIYASWWIRLWQIMGRWLRVRSTTVAGQKVIGVTDTTKGGTLYSPRPARRIRSRSGRMARAAARSSSIAGTSPSLSRRRRTRSTSRSCSPVTEPGALSAIRLLRPYALKAAVTSAERRNGPERRTGPRREREFHCERSHSSQLSEARPARGGSRLRGSKASTRAGAKTAESGAPVAKLDRVGRQPRQQAPVPRQPPRGDYASSAAQRCARRHGLC